MGKIKVIHDLAGRTLTVWLDDPADVMQQSWV